MTVTSTAPSNQFVYNTQYELSIYDTTTLTNQLNSTGPDANAPIDQGNFATKNTGLPTNQQLLNQDQYYIANTDTTILTNFLNSLGIGNNVNTWA